MPHRLLKVVVATEGIASMVFVLASSSPSRIALIRRLGLAPDLTIAPDIDETPLKGELPAAIAVRLAQAKTNKVYEQIVGDHPNAIVLGADTVCAVGRLSLPKALTEEDVRFCLARLSGRRHKIHTGICVQGLNPQGQLQTITRMATTTVVLRRITPQEAEDYIRSREWLGSAGGYSIEGRMACFIKNAMGAGNTNVCGLPFYETYNLLRHFRLL